MNQTSYYQPNRNLNNSPRRQQPEKRKSGHSLIKFISIIVVVIALIAIFSGGSHKNSTVAKAVHSVASKIEKTTPAKAPVVGLSSAQLKTMSESINSLISANTGEDISVNVIDLRNNQMEHYGTLDTFQAASTAKIITAEYFLHEVEEGQQSLTETVGGYSAEYELQQMIVISDDTAWANLDNLLGYDNLQNYADKTFGINDYQAENNSLSSSDIALALQHLWNGNLLNTTHTQLLLSYMKQANYREYIVPAIPSEDTIYHKIGLYEDYVNDSAIVTHGSQAFVIVIFTNGNGEYNWTARATLMQQMTKAALTAYFNQ
jgi:beta-lactamase class A